MGRHRDPDPRWFWLSLGAALGKALLAFALVLAVVFGLTRVWGTGDGGAEVDLAGQADAEASTPTARPSEGTESVGEEPAQEPADEASEDATETESADGSGTESDGGDDAPVRATVQVLNASDDDAALRDVIAVLEDLGYQVVAEGRASRAYARTTVFWSADHEDEARALRAADRRFAVLEPNERLAPTIGLHVVIGRDWDAD